MALLLLLLLLLRVERRVVVRVNAAWSQWRAPDRCQCSRVPHRRCAAQAGWQWNSGPCRWLRRSEIADEFDVTRPTTYRHLSKATPTTSPAANRPPGLEH